MRLFICCLSLVLLVNCKSEPKESTDNILQERISRIENGLIANLQIEGDSIRTYNIEERLKELQIPGLSVAVINNGKLEWAKGYGIADSSENRKVTSNTLFLAGSISKPVAATRAHQLAENNTIHLDSNINIYLNSWKLPDNEFTKEEKVTTRRILNHTAGLTVWGFPGYDKGDTIPSVPDVLDGLGNTDSVRVYKTPGESWMYSGGGYTIMQLMITDIEGEPFPEIMQKHVLDPIGMTGSTFENPLPEAMHGIAATGYRETGEEVEGKWPIYPEMAAAGLWTTASELVLWAKEIQNIYQNKEDGLLKVETVNDMLTPGMNNHGLGPGANEFTFGHGGADEGFRAQMLAWKDHPVAVVIMVNSDNRQIIQELLLSIAKEYELPNVEPQRRSIINLTEQDRRKYEGTYAVPEMGEVKLSVYKRGLLADASFSESSLYILPESDSIYFHASNGQNFKFEISNDSILGFSYGRIQAKKIN